MPRILKNIDARFEKVAKASRAKANGTTSTDTLAGVTSILGENFEKVGVGEGMAVPVPADAKSAKSFLAMVRGRLTAIGREGQPWAGRKYQFKLDETGDKAEILVRRLSDGEPLPAKVGGRPLGSKNKTDGEGSNDNAPAAAGEGATPIAKTDTVVKDLTAKGGKKASA